MTAKNIHEQILELEETLLKLNARNSVAMLSAILSNNFIEFGSSGKIYSKQEAIKSLSEEHSVQISINDFSVRELSNQIILATYKAVKTDQKNGEKNYSLRSSIWKFADNRWQMIFHQGTPCKS